ncbi:MAG: hypothetical protein AB1430_16420 [Pseudomonadota bacterium]
MAVIRLEVEVDSEVYPELYARLRAIGRVEAREERLRQLAASGLVWEAVRMHGPAATALSPPPPAKRARARPPEAQAVPVLVDVVAPPDEAPALPPPLQTEVRAPGPRSARLKRMLDRGLFKNG